MRRMALGASCMLALVLPATAGAQKPTPRDAGVYEYLYHHVAHKFGPRTPGRNIVSDGLSNGRRVTRQRVRASITELERMLAPPPPPPPAPAPARAVTAPAATSTVASSAATSSAAGATGVPACASESGTNYSTGSDNTNAQSGATGRYQITPGTAANYGCSLATAAAQDACASVIYEHQGASAWVGCGG